MDTRHHDNPIIVGRDLVHDRPRFLRPDDRHYHVTIVGKTGVGKSTLMKRLVVDDIQAGRGVIFIDPHGQEAEEILDYIPPWRTDHVCYFNPADAAHPVGFNPLYAPSREQHDLVVSNFVAACKAIWADSWGPRLEDLLSNSAAALLVTPTPTITAIPVCFRIGYSAATCFDTSATPSSGATGKPNLKATRSG